MGILGKSARFVARLGGYVLVPAGREVHRFGDVTAAEQDTWKAVEPYTMVSFERTLGLMRAVEHVVKWQIPGDFVECGVWRGGSMMAIALTLLRLGERDRTLWLYDTFQGLPTPGAEDRTYAGTAAEAALAATAAREGDDRGYNRAALDLVRANMESTEYPRALVHYVEGKVESTIPATLPGQIALLRLDTDWYESTRHELEHLYPRIHPGGVLVLDDYGHWQGARKAVDEYLEIHQIPLYLSRLDYAGRIAVKPESASLLQWRS